MAKIDFNSVLKQINNTRDLIISCDCPIHISEGEVLHLSNFPHEQYVLYIRSGNVFNGPCSNRSVLRSNTSLTQKLADIVLRRGSNDQLYIIDMQKYEYNSDCFLKLITPVITVEHGISISLTFSVGIYFKYRINPKKVQDTLSAYIKREIISANEYLIQNMYSMVQLEAGAYINSFFENFIAINTYKDAFDAVGQIQANSELLSSHIQKAISINEDLSNFTIELVSAFVTCDDIDLLREKTNVIPEIESKAAIDEIQQKKDNDLRASQQNADIEAQNIEHIARLKRERQAFDQDQETNLINAKNQEEIERGKLAIEIEKQNKQIEIDMYRQREQLLMDVRREDMMFSIETRKMIRDSTKLFLDKYIMSFNEALSKVFTTFDTFLINNGGIEPEKLQPVVDAIKALDVFAQPDEIVDAHLGKMNELLRLENNTTTESSTKDDTNSSSKK